MNKSELKKLAARIRLRNRDSSEHLIDAWRNCVQIIAKDAPHFVYLIRWRSEGGEVEYVKVGITATPKRRLNALVFGCPPGSVEVLAMEELPNRDAAQVAEKAVLLSLRKWYVSGEWMKVPPDEIQRFREAMAGDI